jgi:serine/threonine protein kinase
MAPPNIPQGIGRYQVVRELGRGGMGVIYLAKDPFIDRLVAIKVTLESPPKDPQKLEQFKQIFFNEAKAAGKLMHPHIVSVYDATVEDDACYLVMEYVDGSNLKGYCKEKALLPLEKVVKIIFQCAKALDYAHQNEIIHRDIKPSNIMISTKGDAKISDFGIAMIKGDSGLSQSGSLTGSLYYSSPEQLRGEELTPQTDLFSLGVVMYELLSATKPFKGDTDVNTIYKINNEEPEPLKKHLPDAPESLARIVVRALEKDPTKRYQTGLQLASELSTSFDHLRFLDEEINFEEKYNTLKKIDFFKDFASSELAEVLKVTQWVKYEENSIIITEGEIEDCFYIIIVGEVVVRKQGKRLTVLKKGDCFGEMAYLGKSTRTATIEALCNTILMKVNASVIDQTSNSAQLHFYKVFTNTLINRLTHTSEMLSMVTF